MPQTPPRPNPLQPPQPLQSQPTTDTTGRQHPALSGYKPDTAQPSRGPNIVEMLFDFFRREEAASADRRNVLANLISNLWEGIRSRYGYAPTRPTPYAGQTQVPQQLPSQSPLAQYYKQYHSRRPG